MKVNEQHLEFPRIQRRLNLSDGAPSSLIDFYGDEVDVQKVAVVGAGRGNL